MVHARLAALVAGVGCKVEHIPDVGRPHPLMPVEAAEHVLVILCLILFGVVAAAGLRAVEVRHTLGTVLGEAQRTARVDQMEEVHPQVVQEQARHIPAEVEVPADEVGDVGHRVEGAAHGVAGQRGQAGGVHLVAQVVQLAVIVEHIGLVPGGDGDLIGDAPADDAGVVVVLVDELLHLADGVGAAIGQVLGDVGDLSPDHHAVPVTEVVEVLVVLVVGQPDGVGTQLPDEGHILVVHLAGDGVAHALAVLMAGDAVERIGTAIEEEAVPGVHREGAQTHAGGNFVHHGAVAAQADDTGVEIGVLHAVPEVGSVQVELSVCALSPGHDAAGCVLQLDGDSALAFHEGLDPDVSLAVLEGGGDLDAGVAEVAQRDVVFADHHQADVAVDAAVECKVGLLGVDAVVDAVVHLDGELVVLCQQVGDMDTEGGVAAVVGADVPAVQQNFGAGIDALELQPDFLRSCVERRSGKGGAVGAGAAPVIVAAVLAVFCVPRVGQLHQSGLAVRPGELPVLHELGDASHSFSSRVSVAFSLLCGRFSVFRYYFIKDFSFRKTVAIIGRMVWIFGFALTNRS